MLTFEPMADVVMAIVLYINNLPIIKQPSSKNDLATVFFSAIIIDKIILPHDAMHDALVLNPMSNDSIIFVFDCECKSKTVISNRQ